MTELVAEDWEGVGRQRFYRGDYQGALYWFEEAEMVAQHNQNVHKQLRACEWQIFIWGNVPDYYMMAKCATRLLSLSRKVEDRFYQMASTLRLCQAYAKLDLRNRWNEVRPFLVDGLRCARDLNTPFYEVFHLMSLGEYAVQMKEYDQGLAWLQKALHLHNQGVVTIPKCLFTVGIYKSLSFLMCQRGLLNEAIIYAEIAVGAAREDNNDSYISSALITLAKAEIARSELGTALEITEGVLVQAEQQGWRGLEQEATYLYASIEHLLGHPDISVKTAQRSLELAQSMQLKEEEVKNYLILGSSLHAYGKHEEAVEAIHRARRLSQERDYEDHFHKAEELLASFSA